MDDEQDKQKHHYYNLTQKLLNLSAPEGLEVIFFLQLLIKVDLLEDEAKVWSILFKYRYRLNKQFVEELQRWIETLFVGQACSEVCEELADLLVSIGIYYCESPYGIRPCHMDAIIAFHRISLHIYTALMAYIESPLLIKKSAQAFNSLGNAHTKSAELGIEPVKNIREAIEYYNFSEILRRQLDLEDDLSSTLNNLGMAYQLQVEQLGIKPIQNIEESNKYYEKSVEIQRRLNLKDKLSSTLNNLGNLYQLRAKILKSIKSDIELIRSDVELAIKCYSESVEIRRGLKLYHELSVTLRNLGAAYQALAQVESEAVKLESAIDCYKEASAIQRDLKLECDLASTLNNLGTVYQTLAKRNVEVSANLDRAIAFYLEAKTIREQLGLERALAYTFSNLGAAYLQQSQSGIEPESNRKKAIDCYHKALAFIKPTLFPNDCLKTARTLGDFGFYQGDWKLAIKGYTTAIQAVEQIRIWAGSDQHRQEVLENAIGVYANTIQCHIDLGQDSESRQEASKHYQAAILLTEQARSRYLADLMHSNALYKDGEILTEIQEYLEEYETLQQQIDQSRQQQRQNDPAFSGTHLQFALQDQETVKDTAEDLLRKKEAVWHKLRAKDPVLAGQLEVPHLDFDQLAELITDQPTTAILSFYSTNDHTYIFVVRHSAIGITCDVQTCKNQSRQALQLWIAQNWLIPYKANFDAWIEQIPHRLQELSKKLQVDQLITDYLQGIEELVLIPHIFLHLIPFAALTISAASDNQGVQYLGDCFRLRIVPSAQILKYCHDRENNSFAPTVPGTDFGSVEDATGDRPIVASGFESVAQLLQIPDHQRLRGPQQATLTNYRQLTRTPHIRALHSIHHAGSDLENPLESALLLANHDRLTLGQLMSPGWRMPHLVEVFLSCCETNLGTPNVTDDIVTLSTGFLCAGARSVVSTLWSVDALATALFCNFYYKFREAGSDRPTALQQAQKAMRNLSGEQLKKNSQSLYQQLEQQQQQAEQNRQNYRKQLKALSESHPDHGKVQKGLEYWTRLKNDLDSALYWFEQYQKQAQPFANPYYWSGFVSQGLR